METNPTDTATLTPYLPDSDTKNRVELFLQTLAPAESMHSQSRIVSKLLELQNDVGYLSDVSITVWGKRICTESILSQVDGGKEIVTCIGDFFAFASDTNLSISSFFQIKRVESSITGESFTSIVPPSRCLALYEEDTLVGIFPSKIDGKAYSINDALAQIESKETELAPDIS